MTLRYDPSQQETNLVKEVSLQVNKKEKIRLSFCQGY